MIGAAPVLKVIYSMHPVFAGGSHMEVVFTKPSHEQLIRAVSVLTQNAVDIIGWLNVLINKNPVMIPNYTHKNQVGCTLYIFDPKHINSKMIKEHLAGALGIAATDEAVAEFVRGL